MGWAGSGWFWLVLAGFGWLGLGLEGMFVMIMSGLIRCLVWYTLGA